MRKPMKNLLASTLLGGLAAVLTNCSGNGRGGDGPAPAASFAGDVESLELASTPTVDDPVGGITVTVSTPGRSQSATTNASGTFAIDAAPSGDVSCSHDFVIADVVDGSTITLRSVEIDCTGDPFDRTFFGFDEVFRSIVRGFDTIDASIARLCVSAGGENVERSIRFSPGDPDFSGIAPGDSIEVSLARDFVDELATTNAISAESARILARNQEDPCI